MLLSKLFKASASIAERLCFKTKCLVYNVKDKRQNYLAKLLSCAILGSATIVGFSLYTVSYNKISCDVVDTNSETKILHKVEDVDLEREIIIRKDKIDYSDAINKSRDLLQRLKDEVGAPGIVIGVSVDGEVVWEEGIGYSDVENRIPCSRETVMRIGSISKSITMCAVAKLWEQGKLDLDKPLQEYLPYYPVKSFDGKPVSITCRQLVSHLGGIRHYINKEENNTKHADNKQKEKNADNGNKKKKEIQEFDLKEYYNKEFYKDVKSSLDLFKDDPLVVKPGSKFHYTTFGWTVISAIVEAASKEQFSTHVTKLFKNLGMMHTYLDLNDVLIYHRSRNYMKNKTGLLVNAPYVDNSYKYAGGGFLSTVGDLLNFGNGMLYSFQFKFDGPYQISKKIETVTSNSNSKIQKSLPGYLNSKTIEIMWSPITDTKRAKYGMGWEVFPEKYECQFCERCQFCVSHTGASVGASSVLLILPKKSEQNICDFNYMHLPKGTVVAILANLQAVNLYKLGLCVAQIFDHQSLSH